MRIEQLSQGCGALFVIILMMCPYFAPGATSPTLTLDSLFTKKEEQVINGGEEGPVVEIYSLKESGPSAIDRKPLTLDTPLPKLAPRGFSKYAYVYESSEPGLREGGRERAIGLSVARIEAANEFSSLCTRTSLVPVYQGRPLTDEAIVFYLAPEFSEGFLIPPGNYMLKRESWVEGAAQERLTEEFAVQELRPGWKYSIEMSPRGEGRLLQGLSRK